MNPVTLTLPGPLETAFWESHRDVLIWVDVAFAIKNCIQVLIIDLNLFGLFSWDLAATRPSVVYFILFMVLLRLLQLFYIRTARQRYWTNRPALNLFLKLYAAVVITQNIRAGTDRAGFWDVDWLGGADGVINSSSAIYKALLLPSGATNAIDDAIQHQIPFRFMIIPQIFATIALIQSGWAPITKLLDFHPKLTADAIHLCEVTHHGMSILTGMGGIRDGFPSPSCNDGTVLSRSVLTTQLVFIFLLPLWVAYVFESRAKCAFLAEQRTGSAVAEDADAAAGVMEEWGKRISIVILLCGIFACECAVDVVHWLNWHPVPGTPKLLLYS